MARLLGEVLGWMRAQAGTTSLLRAKWAAKIEKAEAKVQKAEDALQRERGQVRSRRCRSLRARPT